MLYYNYQNMTCALKVPCITSQVRLPVLISREVAFFLPPPVPRQAMLVMGESLGSATVRRLDRVPLLTRGDTHGASGVSPSGSVVFSSFILPQERNGLPLG